MADGDTPKTRIQRALFPKRKSRTPKIKISPKWYSKKRTTLNSKLRQAILDVLPFDLDKNQADMILHAIFDKIVEGVERDGVVTINNLGRFVKVRHKTCKRTYWKNGKHVGYILVPAHYTVRFEACTSLSIAMRDNEDTGRD